MWTPGDFVQSVSVWVMVPDVRQCIDLSFHGLRFLGSVQWLKAVMGLIWFGLCIDVLSSEENGARNQHMPQMIYVFLSSFLFPSYYFRPQIAGQALGPSSPLLWLFPKLCLFECSFDFFSFGLQLFQKRRSAFSSTMSIISLWSLILQNVKGNAHGPWKVSNFFRESTRFSGWSNNNYSHSYMLCHQLHSSWAEPKY